MASKEIFTDTSVTEATVAAGLGFPAERDEDSPEPTGWIEASDDTVSKI